jgi:hypothetical protein
MSFNAYQCGVARKMGIFIPQTTNDIGINMFQA